MRMDIMKQVFIILLLLALCIPSAVGEPSFFTINTGSEERDMTMNGADYYSGIIIPEHLRGSHYAVEIPRDEVSSPLTSWDWRKHNGVTPVKNQGKCGSCYAFGTLGMIESYILINGGGTYDLSEEQAKNCIWENTGCIGGCVQWVINI